MPKTILADFKNASGSRNVFTDTVVDKVLFDKTNLDPDEKISDVELQTDNNDIGHISYEIKGQIGGRADSIRNCDTVDMD
jgi:hypothetical protein